MENKEQFKSNDWEYNCLSDEYFEKLEQVSVDDICNLTKQELDNIPLTWLVDWAEVHDSLSNQLFADWLERIRADRSRLKKFYNEKIIFKGISGNNRTYAINHQFYEDEFTLLGGRIRWRNEIYSPTSEQVKFLNDCFRDFLVEYKKAIQMDDGFMGATFIDKKIYFKILPDFRYQFISVGKKDDIRQDICSIQTFLERSTFFGAIEPQEKKISDKLIAWIKGGDFPLLNAGDMYLRYECKYLCDCATQKVADYLTKLDGQNRCVPQRQVYDLNMITILSAKKKYVRYAHINPRGLSMDIILDGKNYFAIWERDSFHIWIQTHPKDVAVVITIDVADCLLEILNSNAN